MISTSVLVNAVTVEPVAAATNFARCGSIDGECLELLKTVQYP